MEQIYGYARVSTREQNEARQVAALVGAGVLAGDIYMDKQSGADFERVQYRRSLCRREACSGTWWNSRVKVPSGS